MDGPHDLGGKPGYGAIPRGPEAEATFLADWERRVFGIALLGRDSNTDTFRHAMERLPAGDYFGHGYWGRWLASIELLEREADPKLSGRSGPTCQRDVAAAPRFAVGQRVRARREQVPGHTRLPGYARGRRGTIVRQQGGWVFPDTNAHGEGECPAHLYAVRFEGSELWGTEAEPGTAVVVDLFEPYLEAVDDA